ncbi:MAG TPA: hypothetical protein VHG32_10305 [Thermoanaerobaculia bacterium]|jgi:hypothetical protein|nr:hypothetical protein [Thermoanaerobaculia bacterium]
MSAARRTLGCWILSAFLQRGCDPTTARTPRAIWSVRPLSAREAAALNPFVCLASLGLVLAPQTNLRWLPLAPAALGAGRPARGSPPSNPRPLTRWPATA